MDGHPTAVGGGGNRRRYPTREPMPGAVCWRVVYGHGTAVCTPKKRCLSGSLQVGGGQAWHPRLTVFRTVILVVNDMAIAWSSAG